MLSTVVQALKYVFMALLGTLFVVVLLLTHPIFVLTTAISMAITFTKLAWAILRRKFGYAADDGVTYSFRRPRLQVEQPSPPSPATPRKPEELAPPLKSLERSGC